MSIVRENMMNDKFYRPYCGESWDKGCSMPRTFWRKELKQMKCPECGWVSEFPADFIKEYTAKHDLR